MSKTTIKTILTVAQLVERGTVRLVVIPRSLVRVRPVRYSSLFIFLFPLVVVVVVIVKYYFYFLIFFVAGPRV